MLLHNLLFYHDTFTFWYKLCCVLPTPATYWIMHEHPRPFHTLVIGITYIHVAYVVPGAPCLQAAQHKFPRQLPLYTEAEKRQHDEESQHVLCDNCEQYVYDQQELQVHMQRYHPCCFLCADDQPFDSIDPYMDHLLQCKKP